MHHFEGQGCLRATINFVRRLFAASVGGLAYGYFRCRVCSLGRRLTGDLFFMSELSPRRQLMPPNPAASHNLDGVDRQVLSMGSFGTRYAHQIVVSDRLAGDISLEQPEKDQASMTRVAPIESENEFIQVFG